TIMVDQHAMIAHCHAEGRDHVQGEANDDRQPHEAALRRRSPARFYLKAMISAIPVRPRAAAAAMTKPRCTPERRAYAPIRIGIVVQPILARAKSNPTARPWRDWSK